MGFFQDNQNAFCDDCGKPIGPNNGEIGKTCRCSVCRKVWTDRAQAAIDKTKEKTAAKKKAEELRNGMY